MEHSVEYTLADGTEYRLAWDNEDKGGQVHYLIHENGVLKLETWHHAAPEGWTEEEFKSVIVPGTFFNCVARHMQAKEMAAGIENMVDGPVKQLAQMAMRPHMTLTPAQEDYFESIKDRGHDVELLVRVLQDAEVERFARLLDAEPEAEAVEVEASGVRQFFATYYPAILFALAVIGGLAAYYLLVV